MYFVFTTWCYYIHYITKCKLKLAMYRLAIECLCDITVNQLILLLIYNEIKKYM